MQQKDYKEIARIIKNVFSIDYKNQKEIKKYLFLNLADYFEREEIIKFEKYGFKDAKPLFVRKQFLKDCTVGEK